MGARRRIDGVDLSHHQENIDIDYTAAKHGGVKFIYHKATEGTTFVDSAYDRRRAQAKREGIPFGAYHFARPKRGNAADEADHFLSVAKPIAGDMLPVLDLEVNDDGLNHTELSNWVFDFVTTVYRRIGFTGMILYTHFDLDRRPPKVRLWVPRYSNDNRAPVVPKPFFTWTMWQFSNGVFGNPNSVPGIGHVDLNTLHLRFPWGRLRTLRIAEKVSSWPRPKPPRRSEVDRLLKVARGEVGYHEGRSGGHWNNHQKYSPAVPGLEWSQNQAWCATFVSWCAMKAGLSNFFPRTASTDTGAAWFKARGQWSEYPAVGAQVFFGHNGDMNHTGIVRAYDKDFVYTIEGNTNTNGSNEGDGVYLKKRRRRDEYVQGYGYPEVPGGLRSADPNYKRKK